MEPVIEPVIEQSVAPRGWRRAHKIGFRFAFSYLLLYNLPFPAGVVPKTDWLGDAVTWVWHKLGVFVGDHVFGVDITIFSNGSGDTTYDYVLVFAFAMLAAIAAIAWTLADRRRIDYRKLDAALRVYVRYVLAITMMSYGFAKVFKTQFPSPTPDRLQETYGESSPMGLLWTMMGYSPGYNLFTGGVEVLGGALLLWRRTTLLGALVSAGAMTNVVMLNFCYDVPVKLYSTHLLLMSVYVMTPDLGRLAGLLILNRPVAARPPRVRWSRRLEWGRRGVKTALIGIALYTLIDQELDYRKMLAGDSETTPPVVGVFVADEYLVNGAAHPALATDGARWRTFAINGWGGVMVRKMDSSSERYGAWMDRRSHMVVMQPYSDAPPTVLLYTPRDDDHFALTGVVGKQVLQVRLARKADGDQLLMSRGFNWINEYPLNR